MHDENGLSVKKMFKLQKPGFSIRFTENFARCFLSDFLRQGFKFFHLYNNKLGEKIITTQKESSRSDLRAQNNNRLKFYV